MKKHFIIVLALFFCAGTIFSEIALSPNLSIAPSIESRVGFLLYETDNASWFHTERVNTDIHIHSEQPKKRCVVSMGARYLYGISDRTDINGSLHLGSVNAAFSKKFFQVRASFSALRVPHELKILSGEPRLILNDSSAIFPSLGGKIKFHLFDKEWNLDGDFLFGKANVASGDLYYLYGRPNNLLLLGGKTVINAPYGISFLSLGGRLFTDLSTDKNINAANFNISICAFYFAKEFHFPLADCFSIKPFAGYVQLSANGSTWLTPANQTYSLFPFKYVGGDFDGKIHFLSAGLSFDIKKGGFAFSLDFVYLACIKNTLSGRYAYQFKKNIFFDGSSDEAAIPFPNTAATHFFAGVMEASYRFNIHKNFIPTIKITKMIAAAILNQETDDFINGTDSSTYSTVSDPQITISDSGPSTAEIIKRALLSGTSVAIKIEF